MKQLTTAQAIAAMRTNATDGEVWMEGDRLNWKGRPPTWALLFKRAIEDRNEAEEALDKAETLLVAERERGARAADDLAVAERDQAREIAVQALHGLCRLGEEKRARALAQGPYASPAPDWTLPAFAEVEEEQP